MQANSECRIQNSELILKKSKGLRSSEILRLRSLCSSHFVARGCRPFSTEKESQALSPGVSNPRMTFLSETNMNYSLTSEYDNLSL